MVTFKDGSEFSIVDFKDLILPAGSLSKFKCMHLKVNSSFRHSTSLATQMVSENNANLFFDFSPNYVNKASASEFCHAMKKGFKV